MPMNKAYLVSSLSSLLLAHSDVLSTTGPQGPAFFAPFTPASRPPACLRREGPPVATIRPPSMPRHWR